MNQENNPSSLRETFEVQTGPAGREIRLSLPAFEGPMDLLLFLIKREEVDIFDIPISMLTVEYLKYLEAIEADNLEIGGEFLVMAATLLSIKARMLLPRPRGEGGEPIEDDPRIDLVERILEYKAFKESAQLFRRLEEEHSQRFIRTPAPTSVDIDELHVQQALEDVSLYDLLAAFRFAMDQFKAEEKHYKPYIYSETVDRKMDELRQWLDTEAKILFSTVIQKQKSRLAIIVVFLAILELVRIGNIKLGRIVDNDFLLQAKD